MSGNKVLHWCLNVQLLHDFLYEARINKGKIVTRNVFLLPWCFSGFLKLFGMLQPEAYVFQHSTWLQKCQYFVSLLHCAMLIASSALANKQLRPSFDLLVKLGNTWSISYSLQSWQAPVFRLEYRQKRKLNIRFTVKQLSKKPFF